MQKKYPLTHDAALLGHPSLSGLPLLSHFVCCCALTIEHSSFFSDASSSRLNLMCTFSTFVVKMEHNFYIFSMFKFFFKMNLHKVK